MIGGTRAKSGKVRRFRRSQAQTRLGTRGHEEEDLCLLERNSMLQLECRPFPAERGIHWDTNSTVHRGAELR